ncbi:MAG: hypothetical protein K5888_02825 [Lachnospiraceae bacterium]|nr:hypothetical protein [Lachnospiraceae bacterium]
MNNNYINKVTETALLVKKKVRMIIGGVGAVFFAVGFIPGVMDDVENPGSTMGLCGFMVLIFGFIFFQGFKLNKDLDLANRYSQIFAGDEDGVVTYGELARAMNKGESAIAKELERLFKKRMFKDCTLELQGAPRVRLANTSGKNDGFITIKCPHCGGTNKLRTDTSGVCEYCGGAIKA